MEPARKSALFTRRLVNLINGVITCLGLLKLINELCLITKKPFIIGTCILGPIGSQIFSTIWHYAPLP